jgi:hypothetical protein
MQKKTSYLSGGGNIPQSLPFFVVPVVVGTLHVVPRAPPIYGCYVLGWLGEVDDFGRRRHG